ncbi:MAG: hypothetical protein KJ709_04540 [Nanoarchaeota archaeon]|nr:hypothetical protein [Nanoarchaeota archaeon]
MRAPSLDLARYSGVIPADEFIQLYNKIRPEARLREYELEHGSDTAYMGIVDLLSHFPLQLGFQVSLYDAGDLSESPLFVPHDSYYQHRLDDRLTRMEPKRVLFLWPEKAMKTGYGYSGMLTTIYKYREASVLREDELIKNSGLMDSSKKKYFDMLLHNKEMVEVRGWK